MVVELTIWVCLWMTASISKATTAQSIARPGCQATCGNISIPYPFGIGIRCYHNNWYEIFCNTSSSPPRPFLRRFSLEVEHINFKFNQTLTVRIPMQLREVSSGTGNDVMQGNSPNLTGSPFLFSSKYNVFLVGGCTASALLLDSRNRILAGCATSCPRQGYSMPSSENCYGVQCCQTIIPSSLVFFRTNFTTSSNYYGNSSNIPNSAALIESNSVSKFIQDPFQQNSKPYPTVFQWKIMGLGTDLPGYQNSTCEMDDWGGGYNCRCITDYYKGNPYLPNGCQASISKATTAQSIARPGCQATCGNISIPYPFGIGENCYQDNWYEIFCNTSSSPPRPFLRPFSLEVEQINFEDNQTLTVRIPMQLREVSSGADVMQGNSPNLTGSPFLFSGDYNVFLVGGCTGSALLLDSRNQILTGCATICPQQGSSMPSSENCYGVLCCQTIIPSSSLVFYRTNFTTSSNSYANGSNISNSAALIESNSVSKFIQNPTQQYFQPYPTVFQWTIMGLGTDSPGYINSTCETDEWGGYNCRCINDYYKGNPYLPYSCQVVKECEDCINECLMLGNFSFRCPIVATPKPPKPPYLSVGIGIAAALILLLFGFCIYKKMKKRRENRMKAKFFKQNGGLLLKQQMSSSGGVVDKTRVFTSEELDKATDHYNKDRILGQGGQGTVYKGMLTDGRIVAIKKSKLMEESQLEQFINELVILSNINHRNIVKLLGCCLETEVPLLVYEFIPNGTLFQHIHDPVEEFPLTWKKRLQICTDVATALAYLHSASSIPIYHRDVKSSNILLDSRFRAKVSDFGTSRSITIDQTHLTATNVSGTLGYLDPEYFQSHQFTDKSDVYSFGVVVVELLTGQRAIRLIEPEGNRSLVSWFLSYMKKSDLFDIVDGRVLMEGEKEDILAVANLARRCLNLDGNRRPTMKEAAKELEAVGESYMPPSEKYLQQNEQSPTKTAEILTHTPSTSSMPGRSTSFSIDVHPLLFDTA